MVENFRRDPDVSSSELGQYIHDNYPVHFYFADIDGAIYKKATRMKRVLECKRPGQPLKASQKWLLEDVAKEIGRQIELGLISPESGVFGVWGDPPFDEIRVRQIGGTFEALLRGEAKDRFLQGLPLEN